MAPAFVGGVPGCLRPNARFPGTTRTRPGGAVGNAVTMVQAQKRSKREERRVILKSDKFHRMDFKEVKEAATKDMESQYFADVMQEFKANGNRITRGDVTFVLADSYGFCWGVDRAVSLAFQAVKRYPGRRIWLTNEIIHNPYVNQQLRDLGVEFVPQEGLKKDYSAITGEDVVVLPAFGATHEEIVYLHETAHAIVDTTCPWVSRIWNVLDKHIKIDATSIIHGKYAHEETVATKSFSEKHLIVLNMDEAKYVADYMQGKGGSKDEFMQKFQKQMSEGFDPDVDLKVVGVANQTTMLKSETTAIGKLFEFAQIEIHGVENINKHYVATDTICDATQHRQDAMEKLLLETDLDMMLVVGGFNSSNTSHLQEMAEHAGVTSYWIDSPGRIQKGNKVLARTAAGEERVVDGWLPDGKITVGVTSGASSPDNQVADAIDLITLAKSQ